MSFIFWGLLALSVLFTTRSIYGLTEEVRRYKRGEHVGTNMPAELDMEGFYARWTFTLWSLTIVWGVIEGTIRLLT